MGMLVLAWVFIFMLGLFAGSFLNVLVLRLNTGRSIFGGRSVCFSCGKTLHWHELVPLISFLFLRGRCRTCKSKISWQYPAVEIITGLVFVGVFWKLQLGAVFSPSIFNFQFSIFNLLAAAYWLAVSSILLAIAVYDIRHKIIPNQLVYAFNLLAFLSLLAPSIVEGFRISDFGFRISDPVTAAFLTGVVFFVLFGGLWLLSRGRWMGFGDAKLVLGIGWILGPSLGIAALILAFWIGAAYGLLVLLSGRFRLFKYARKVTMKSEVPFGPFLILGTFLSFFFDISFFVLQNLLVF